MASVLIVAPQDDLHALGVFHDLRRRNVNVDWVDLASEPENFRLALSIDGTCGITSKNSSGKLILFSEVDTIWWRRPRMPQAVASSEGERGVFLLSEWDQFLASIEPLTSLRWVNPPGSSQRARCKALQLSIARSEGLRVPHTVITNDPNVVHELASQERPIVYKRLGWLGGPAVPTRLLRPEDLSRLDTLVNCPAIFQEHIPAELDIRVTSIGGEMHAAEIHSQAGGAPLDWRLDHSVPFRRHCLDQVTATKLSALLRRLDLVYGAIDLRLTPGGEYVFFEVNPAGQYLFVELLAGIPLTERMASFLARL